MNFFTLTSLLLIAVPFTAYSAFSPKVDEGASSTPAPKGKEVASTNSAPGAPTESATKIENKSLKNEYTESNNPNVISTNQGDHSSEAKHNPGNTNTASAAPTSPQDIGYVGHTGNPRDSSYPFQKNNQIHAKGGETLSGIAKAHGYSVYDVFLANNKQFGESETLESGQIITLPHEMYKLKNALSNAYRDSTVPPEGINPNQGDHFSEEKHNLKKSKNPKSPSSTDIDPQSTDRKEINSNQGHFPKESPTASNAPTSDFKERNDLGQFGNTFLNNKNSISPQVNNPKGINPNQGHNPNKSRDKNSQSLEDGQLTNPTGINSNRNGHLSDIKYTAQTHSVPKANNLGQTTNPQIVDQILTDISKAYSPLNSKEFISNHYSDPTYVQNQMNSK